MKIIVEKQGDSYCHHQSRDGVRPLCNESILLRSIEVPKWPGVIDDSLFSREFDCPYCRRILIVDKGHV
jgi:hypothetical protein